MERTHKINSRKRDLPSYIITNNNGEDIYGDIAESSMTKALNFIVTWFIIGCVIIVTIVGLLIIEFWR